MPTQDEKKVNKLIELLKLSNTDYVSIDDFSQSFQVFLGLINSLKVANEKDKANLISSINTFQEKIVKDNQGMKEILATKNEDIKAQIQAIIEELQTIELTPGETGEAGADSSVPGPVGPKGEDGSPDSPDEIRNKLELLSGDERLDKSAIKGLEDLASQSDVQKLKNLPAFNPTMGPSFADLQNIKTTVTTVQNQVNSLTGAVSINYIIDGGGSAITTGVKGFVEIPYSMTITGWQVMADQVGSVVVDVWRSNYAGFPPVVGGSIAGSDLPTLSSAQVNNNLAVSSWTVLLAKGDIIGYNVNSASTVQRITVSIIGVKN